MLIGCPQLAPFTLQFRYPMAQCEAMQMNSEHEPGEFTGSGSRERPRILRAPERDHCDRLLSKR